MRPFIRLHSVLVLALLGSSAPLLANQVCRSVNADEFARYIGEKKPEEIVFFASWCGGCVAHLRAADSQTSVLVAAFDEKKAAEKALGSLFKENGPACFFDQDGSIVKAYDVSGLPSTKKLTMPPASGS